MPEITRKFSLYLMCYRCILETAKGKGQTAHTIERQAVTANPPERKENRMFGDKTKRADKKAKREVAKNRAKENPIIAILSGDGALDHMILRKKTIIHTQSGDGEKPLGGVVARIESGRELKSRITLTRIALLGAFALAAPKRKGGEKFVSIEGPGFIWWMEVDRKRAGDAARFVAKVNQQVKIAESK